MENEIMNVEEAMEDVVTDGKKLGTGKALLIGAVGLLAVTAGIKLGKKVVAVIKAKKETKNAAENHNDLADDFEEV